ncbi:hypothetical protein OUZ56_029625 [Daphnia magna]|uniref:Uncharacterized protein n=1 Tax=Daphnia magna TaxID=35525 RepID=A0ABR0B7E0_9CRUS|nr:hypothetical protein OUZ56_029625 [Daphnia magna]
MRTLMKDTFNILQLKTKCNRNGLYQHESFPTPGPSGTNTDQKRKNQKQEGETTNSLLKVHDDHQGYKQDGKSRIDLNRSYPQPLITAKSKESYQSFCNLFSLKEKAS